MDHSTSQLVFLSKCFQLLQWIAYILSEGPKGLTCPLHDNHAFYSSCNAYLFSSTFALGFYLSTGDPVGHFFYFVWNKIGHNVKENFGEGLNLPVWVGIKTKMLGPWEMLHTIFDCIGICFVVMPNFSLSWRRRGYFQVDFTIHNLVVALRIQRWPRATV